jgi:hypothetical protein
VELAPYPFAKIKGSEDMRKIEIKKLPELKTSVGIHGSVKQKEVGGMGCLGVLCVIVIA